MADIHKILLDTFGFESFRDGQEAIVQNLVDGEDTLVFMPTGGWKSLTYQLPGIARKGVTLIISPLISLMKDQVDALRELGVRAELINSTIDPQDKRIIFDELSRSDNEIKFLYIAPERLNASDFLSVIQKVDISLLAIDEAHCISQWWHDFRPSYMKIKGFIDSLRGSEKTFPIVALTATATQKVRNDIVERLGLEEYSEFTKWFDRKNITIVVREISKKEEKFEKVSEILSKTPGSWIIYCSSRKNVDEVYQYLLQNSVRVWKYTGAMPAEEREGEQNNFMTDEYKVIVATNAFGMGIDKKDIRFVIHFNLPWSIENYYQEVWRAWRDGKQSFWVVLASFGDTKIQEFFIENTYPSKAEILQVYDYVYKGTAEWEGVWKAIFETYFTLASNSWINNDMKVASAIRILEKYGVLERGVTGITPPPGFRWRGMTLIKEKRKHSALLIDWRHQDLLKQESYFKLDQIKQLLFYPSCRKKFILEYFGDKEDLKTLKDSCGSCDYCVDKKKFDSEDQVDYVHTSVFSLVLEVINTYDERYGAQLLAKFMRGSADKRLIEWNMHKKQNFWALQDLTPELISAIIDALISQDYLYKSTWKFPLLGITQTGELALKKEQFLIDDNKELQHYIRMKLGGKPAFRADKNEVIKEGSTKTATPRGATYDETLKLFEQGISLDEISKQREMWIQTIEEHICKLYGAGKVGLGEVMKLTPFSKAKIIKQIIDDVLSWDVSKLKPIRDAIIEAWEKSISYFDIKLTLVMIEKKDI